VLLGVGFTARFSGFEAAVLNKVQQIFWLFALWMVEVS
jgi:hypothetical protein